MKEKFTQTYWNENLSDPKMMDKFVEWVGNSEAESKKFFRNLVKEKNITDILDIGCGCAVDYEPLLSQNPKIKYVGVESCVHHIEKNEKRGVPMIFSDATNLNISDNSHELAYSRHTFEHQPDFVGILSEMIRVSSKYVAHIFFIKPTLDPNKVNINYDSNVNLYHNTYSRTHIQVFCEKNQKVKNIEWLNINEQEEMLFITLK